MGRLISSLKAISGKFLNAGLVVAVLGVTAAGCFVQDQIFGSHSNTVRGRVSFGFEEAAFRPCGSDEQWWITGSDNHVNELQTKWKDLGLEWYTPGYAEVEGNRSDKGEYGHLGAYQREFEVSDVKEVRLLHEGECPWPNESH